MIKYQKGDLLEADVEALINAVNCVGVMGKGIALQFKKKFPENFKIYKQACESNQIKIGEMFVVSQNSIVNPRVIINFPTKQHWKETSKLHYIQAGLTNLTKIIKEYNIKSIAVPALGCGNGGLDWKEVQPLIESVAIELPDVLFIVFPPA